MNIRREGTVLAYEEAGEGDPPMLLVHGWAMDRSTMKALFDDAKRSRRVVSLDLRGFGESDAPEQRYTMEAYSDDLAFVIERLGLSRPIVVGHSMGGMVALDLASRHAGQVSAAVVLEAMVVAPERVLAGLRDMLEHVRGNEHRSYVSRLMGYLMGPHFDGHERRRLLAIADGCRQDVLVSALEGMIALDSVAAARRVECPVLYVGTDTTYSDLPRFMDLCPGLVTGKVVCSGHYFPVEVPEQVSPMLARFVRTHVRAGDLVVTSRPAR